MKAAKEFSSGTMLFTAGHLGTPACSTPKRSNWPAKERQHTATSPSSTPLRYRPAKQHAVTGIAPPGQSSPEEVTACEAAGVLSQTTGPSRDREILRRNCSTKWKTKIKSESMRKEERRTSDPFSALERKRKGEKRDSLHTHRRCWSSSSRARDRECTPHGGSAADHRGRGGSRRRCRWRRTCRQ